MAKAMEGSSKKTPKTTPRFGKATQKQRERAEDVKNVNSIFATVRLDPATPRGAKTIKSTKAKQRTADTKGRNKVFQGY